MGFRDGHVRRTGARAVMRLLPQELCPIDGVLFNTASEPARKFEGCDLYLDLPLRK